MSLLDPSNDFVFKLLFREPSDERRLIAMLTAVLEPPVPIRAATVLNPELPADVVGAKSIRLDLLVELGDGRRVNVEMESWPRAVFVARELYYWARVHGGQLKEGEDYTALRPTVAIAWLGDARGTRRALLDPERVHTRYRLCETSTGRELTDQIELHLLDLCNLATDATLSPALRRWARFFDHPTEQTLAELTAEDPIMAETVQKLSLVSDDAATRRLAEARREAAIFERIDRAMERDLGRAEGRADGLAEGLARGREEGREEGRSSGMRLGLLQLLEFRFGPLPDVHAARLHDATSPELERLMVRARSAPTLDAVFDG